MLSKKNMQVKKEVKEIDFYFTVVDLLQERNSLNRVASKLGISKQLLSNRILPLKIAGVIEKKGYGVWIVNKENFKEFLERKEVKEGNPHTILGDGGSIAENTIRGHAFTFTIKIPEIQQWGERTKFLEKEGIAYNEKVRNRTSLVLKLDNAEYTVWLCKSSIVIHFPKGMSFYDPLAKNTELQAAYVFKKAIVRLENIFGVSLRIGADWQFRPSRKHFSLIQNQLAKKYNDDKRKLFVSDIDGLWLLIDNSFNLNELEVIRAPAGRDQAEVTQQVAKVFNDIAQHPELPMPSEIYAILSQITQQISEVVNNQLFHEANIRSHIESIQKMSSILERMDKRLEDAKLK